MHWGIPNTFLLYLTIETSKLAVELVGLRKRKRSLTLTKNKVSSNPISSSKTFKLYTTGVLLKISRCNIDKDDNKPNSMIHL